MANKKSSPEKRPTTSPSDNPETLMANNPTSTAVSTTPAKETPTAVFAAIGLVLGLIVGFVVTDSINAGAAPKKTASQSAGPLTGNEKMPDNHPTVDKVDVEGEAQKAIEFGKQNLDYDSQMRVGNFLYVQTRKLKEAQPFLEKAHELKPNEVEPIVQIGNINFDIAQETSSPQLMLEAAKWYEKALALKPDDINVRTDLGLTYYYRQPPNYEEAISNYDKSLAIQAKHPPTLYNKGVALAALKKFEESEAIYQILQESGAQKELLDSLRTEIDKAKTGNNVKIPSH
jgi:tetratricopeptide (TPR) repeat protein